MQALPREEGFTHCLVIQAVTFLGWWIVTSKVWGWSSVTACLNHLVDESCFSQRNSPTSKNLRTKKPRAKGAQNLPQLQQGRQSYRWQSLKPASKMEIPLIRMFKNFLKTWFDWFFLYEILLNYCKKQKMLIKWWVITQKILQQWVGYRSNSKQMAPNQLWELLTRLAPATGVCKATEKEMSWNPPDVRVATGGCWRFPWEKIHMFPVVFQDPCWLPGITQRPLPPR